MLRIVIVEDEDDIAYLEAFPLEERGHSVRVVTSNFATLLNGGGGWDNVDVALIDLMLPTQDGEDIVRHLYYNFPHVRRIICTAAPSRVKGEVASLAHVLLTKPFSAKELIAAIEAAPARA